MPARLRGEPSDTGQRSPEPDRLATEEGQASTDHRVVLPSLPPGTQVRYRVEGGTEIGWFTSAPKQGGEGVKGDVGLPVGDECAADPGDEGPDGEAQKLDAGDIDPRSCGRTLS